MTRKITLAIGQIYLLRSRFVDQNGAVIQATPATTTYTSDTPSVASVDGTGKITAIAEGRANIKAVSQSLNAMATITVYTPVPTTLTLT